MNIIYIEREYNMFSLRTIFIYLYIKHFRFQIFENFNEFSNYLPCSHLSPLKPGGHVQAFSSENPPLRQFEDGVKELFCSLLSKISDVLYLA